MLNTRTGPRVPLECPRCRTPLVEGEQAVSCPACGGDWPVKEGITSFVEGYSYWGEFPREELVQLTEKARATGWKEAVSAAFQEQDPARYESIASSARAGWLPLLPVSPQGAALEVGAGLGAVAQVLANHFGSVCCLEPVEERLRFLKLRMEQEGLKNVKSVQAALPDLPFPDATFDAAVLMGVLEWVGEWMREMHPRKAQLVVLEKMRSKLKPGGALLIGIENRMGYTNFRGRRDHSGLPFTSLMPRWLASLTVRLAPSDYRTPGSRRDGYRTYTYGLAGYRKLLEEAGFRDVAFYFPHPGYAYPVKVFPLANRDALRQLLGDGLWQRAYWKARAKKSAARLAARLGILPLIVPDLLIVARRGE